MKRGGRKHKDGDYGRRSEKPVVQKVAMSIEPTAVGTPDTMPPLRFAFRGCSIPMLKHVFRRLKDKLFNDYEISIDNSTTILNGKCYLTLFVDITGPNIIQLSVCEWPTIIKYIMERTFRCRVVFFEKYKDFMNT